MKFRSTFETLPLSSEKYYIPRLFQLPYRLIVPRGGKKISAFQVFVMLAKI